MKHLTIKDRFYIEKALKNKVPVSQIAKTLGFDRSTIYKEIKRGKFPRKMNDWSIKEEYAHDVGQRKHDELSHNKGAKKKLAPDNEYLQQISEWILKKKYSPEAAAYRVKDKKCCVKTLYNYIHAGYVPGVEITSLPYARKKKKKKTDTVKRTFTRGKSIEERPKEIKERKTKGHWEMDTVYSSRNDKTCLLVLTERKDREELIFQIKDRTCASVLKALNSYERKIGCRAFREKFKSITCDNGMEFADWEGIERSIRNKTPRTVTYFCHPYCSGERGSNENQNKMIRRWIPKGDDIGLYTLAEIHSIQEWLNDYPRKMFSGKSANEMMM